MKKQLRIFIIVAMLFLDIVCLSSQLTASVPKFHSQLDAVDQALAKGLIRPSEAAYQKTYFLTADPRYDSAKYGPRPSSNNNMVYDCSATIMVRQQDQWRRKERDLDPYGLLWKSWLEEADRIRKLSDARIRGQISGVPIKILAPRGRLHAKAAPFKRISASLAGFIAQFNKPLSVWAKDVFGDDKIKPWTSSLAWPPDFLQDRLPYLHSYFDSHPVFDAGRTKQWGRPLSMFLGAVGANNKDGAFKTSQPSWTWVVSDRIERNALLWDGEGRSILFLSMPCLDRVIQSQWIRQHTWTKALNEMVLHEILLTYYLNNRPQSFMRDPNMDAVVQGIAQNFLPQSGLQYSQGPFFKAMGEFSLSNDSRTDYGRYWSSPLWNFFYRVNGPEFVRDYLKVGRRPEQYLKRAMRRNNKKGISYQSFIAWALGLDDMPASLRANIPSVRSVAGTVLPQDIELKPIVPPKGTIGAATSPFKAQSFRLFRVPIKSSRKVAALNLRWQPVAPQLDGHLFLVDNADKHNAKYLAYTSVKPGTVQQIFLDPVRPPTEALFVVVNPSSKNYPGKDLQLQVSIVEVPES